MNEQITLIKQTSQPLPKSFEMAQALSKTSRKDFTTDTKSGTAIWCWAQIQATCTGFFLSLYSQTVNKNPLEGRQCANCSAESNSVLRLFEQSSPEAEAARQFWDLPKCLKTLIWVSQKFNLISYKVRPLMVYWIVWTQNSTWCTRMKLLEASFLLLCLTSMVATSWPFVFTQLQFVSLQVEDYSNIVSCPIQVTTQLLMTTNGGKRLRALTKHQDLNIKATAAEVLNVWKGTIAAQNSAEAKAAQKAKEQLGESHASHHFIITLKNIVFISHYLLSYEAYSRSTIIELRCRKLGLTGSCAL